MESTPFQHRLSILRDLLTRKEFDFPSNKPLIGPIIQFVRKTWNNIAPRWYVQYYANQQHSFDSLLLETLQDVFIYQAELEKRINQLEWENKVFALHLQGMDYSLEQVIRYTQVSRVGSSPDSNDSSTL